MKGGYAVVRRVKHKDGLATYSFISEPCALIETAQAIADDLNRWSAGTTRGEHSDIQEIGYHIVMGIT